MRNQIGSVKKSRLAGETAGETACPTVSSAYFTVTKRSQRGGALLAVLWLSAALSAIALSLASTVRGETERAGTQAESVRAHFLAVAAIDRHLAHRQWGHPAFDPALPRRVWQFPSGIATLELIPESGKLNINQSPPDEILRLLVNLGVEPARAQEITAAILDWRAPSPDAFSPFDQFYAAAIPSFRARHASLEEIEELLFVKGMTPEVFYGGHTRDAQGRLIPLPGLRDCVTTYGLSAAIDINTAQPAVLATLGLSPDAVAAIVARRHALPFTNPQELTAFSQGAGPGFQRLRIGGNTIWSLKSTAQMRQADGQLSDLRRTVTAMIKFHRTGTTDILRWYEN